MTKKIILIIGIFIIIVSGIFIYQRFIKEKPVDFVLEKAVSGTIVQEVLETGIVKTAEEVKLSFQSPGKIEKIYVKVGQEVKAGQNLIKLNTDQLEIQLTGAQASLELAQARLNHLLAGTSPEEIKLAETAVLNAEVSLVNAKRNLEDIKTQASNNLNQAYDDGLIALNSAYLKLYNAFNTVNEIQRTYFIRADQEGIIVRSNKDKIENALNNVKLLLQAENVDAALVKTREALSTTTDALGDIRDIFQTSINYRHIISNSDKISLDIERTNINTALTNIVNSQQVIFSTKLTNKININTAQSKVDSNEGQLQSAQNTLSIKKAGSRQADIDMHNAQIKQAQANVNLLKEQISQALLKSPFQGKVVEIYKKREEAVQIIEPVISIISVDDFQIEVDIYEEDIVKVKTENPVDITLIAFPAQTFQGKVISINPTEKLIGGVVYYEVIIGFKEEAPKVLKSGMTADIRIITASKENVLVISEDAIQEKNDEVMVQVFKNGLIQDRIIEIGLKGDDDRVEVVSGLQEGETVVIQ